MGQVDDVLDRLAREIAERDARIAELTVGDGRPTCRTARRRRRASSAGPDDDPNP